MHNLYKSYSTMWALALLCFVNIHTSTWNNTLQRWFHNDPTTVLSKYFNTPVDQTKAHPAYPQVAHDMLQQNEQACSRSFWLTLTGTGLIIAPTIYNTRPAHVDNDIKINSTMRTFMWYSSLSMPITLLSYATLIKVTCPQA